MEEIKAKKEEIKVCCISDTHCFASNVKLQPVDLLIHCGDFTARGYQRN